LFQCQYCLIFPAATRLSFYKQSPCVYTSPPVQGIVACVRVGSGGFELHIQAWYGFCNFPKFSRSGNFFPRNGKFFRDPGKSSPVNIPTQIRTLFSSWGFDVATIHSLYLGYSLKFRDIFADEQLCYAMTVDPRFKMVAEKWHKRAVDAIIRAMECATGTSQQADQPSVPPLQHKPVSRRRCGPSLTKLLPVIEHHRRIILRMRCVTSLRAISASPKSLGRHRRSPA